MDNPLLPSIPPYAVPLLDMLNIQLKPDSNWQQVLEDRINHLIQADFNRLVSILYRTDVEEDKLKAALKAHPNRDAASVIADLLIERQQRKFQYRNK